MEDTTNLTWKEKFWALKRVSQYRPEFTFGLVLMGAFVALLEGVGLGFINPILEVAQEGESVGNRGRVLSTFLAIYEFFGIPFSLEYLILGVSGVMIFRYTMSFAVAWLKNVLTKEYEKDLRTRAFSGALNAKINYFDEKGSDDVLNAIITETRYSSKVITHGVQTMQTAFLVLMYFSVMFYISLTMTLLATVLLGGITLLLRVIIEPAMTVGSRVAEANERVQQSVQAGTQGIRDVKLFNLGEEVFATFQESVEQYARSEINLSRNEAAISQFYELSAALTLFGLIYIGFVFTGLSFGELGIFLIAMFQTAPKVSRLNSYLYRLEGEISHLVRTHEFLDTISEQQESNGEQSITTLEEINFDNVHFSYEEDEPVLRGISFRAKRGDFIAFVGESGAGKSTIVSLLARMYTPDRGEIRADRVPIEKYNLDDWRERIAVVRQQPFIFNTTLEENITVGNRDASRSEVERVCEIAQVTQFLDELPNGYESELGDNGVMLSGGQRQRVSLARALLKNADFLLLDEATSDLDSNLEQKVQSAIESMDRDYGIIAIAHRLSTVKNADRIHTVDKGEIIESGTHEELLLDDGEYAELYSIQSKA